MFKCEKKEYIFCFGVLMILETAKFGKVEVNDNYIFDFVEPIIGYENIKHFALIDCDEKSPFKWLQAIEDLSLAMPVTIPAYFGIEYKFYIPDDKVELLEAKEATDILSLNITNVPNGAPQNATVNLLAPVVVNINNKKALQLILSDTNFPVRYRLFGENDK